MSDAPVPEPIAGSQEALDAIAESLAPGTWQYLVDAEPGDFALYPTKRRDTDTEVQRFHHACERAIEAAKDPEFWKRIGKTAARLERGETWTDGPDTPQASVQPDLSPKDPPSPTS